jgi:hypothetical protein
MVDERAERANRRRVVPELHVRVSQHRLRLDRIRVVLGQVPEKRQRVLRESPRVKHAHGQSLQVSLVERRGPASLRSDARNRAMAAFAPPFRMSCTSSS